ncbi:hypothetical protein L7F22_003517 [Adiantum nelumboides]|nr:hypothetical protein [Adiantum nelumboides]
MFKNDGISGLVSDKLDKNNFHAWKFRMTNFLMGKGYWDYIDCNQEEMLKLPDVNPTAEQIKVFKDWNQGARKVMYWLSVSVQDTMIGHIQDATSPKQAWDRSSTQTEAEVEDVVQAKDEVVVMATKIKANSSVNQMMHNGQTSMDVEIIKAGGVKEVTKITKEIMQIMKTKNAGVVEEHVTLNAYLVERTPSLSELNEIVYGQDHVMRDDRSYIFLLKVADNATLYGVCVYVPELVKQPPGIMAINFNLRLKSSPAPINRFSLTTYRCYCLLTKLPFFDLHFELLNSIITQERLERITDCVNEMVVSPYVNGGCDSNSGAYLDQNGLMPHEGIDSLPSPDHDIEQAFHLPNEHRPSSLNGQASANGLTTPANDRSSDSPLAGNFAQVASSPSQDPLLINNVAAGEAIAFAKPIEINGELSVSLELNKDANLSRHMGIVEERGPSTVTEVKLQRVDSMDSVNSTTYSFRQSATSDDDDAEEASSAGQEYNFLSQPELVWAEADHCLLQILYEYYKHPVPARGSSLVFQPLEHLPPLKFTRAASETSTLLGGKIIDPKLCRTSLDMVEVQSALTAAEEAVAISFWSIATVCRVLSLENVSRDFCCSGNRSTLEQ